MASATASVNSPVAFQCFTSASLIVVCEKAGTASAASVSSVTFTNSPFRLIVARGARRDRLCVRGRAIQILLANHAHVVPLVSRDDVRHGAHARLVAARGARAHPGIVIEAAEHQQIALTHRF